MALRRCPEFGQTRVSRAKVLREESPFFKKEFVFVNTQKIKNEIIPAGNYEYSFEVVIPGDTPESVEGLGESWIIYRLKATIDRGRLAQNHYARKHLRVVRTFDPSALELAHEMVSDCPSAADASTSNEMSNWQYSGLRTSGLIRLSIPSVSPTRLASLGRLSTPS